MKAFYRVFLITYGSIPVSNSQLQIFLCCVLPIKLRGQFLRWQDKMQHRIKRMRRKQWMNFARGSNK